MCPCRLDTNAASKGTDHDSVELTLLHTLGGSTCIIQQQDAGNYNPAESGHSLRLLFKRNLQPGGRGATDQQATVKAHAKLESLVAKTVRSILCVGLSSVLAEPEQADTHCSRLETRPRRTRRLATPDKCVLPEVHSSTAVVSVVNSHRCDVFGGQFSHSQVVLKIKAVKQRLVWLAWPGLGYI